VGAGFSGTLLALLLHRLGFQVILLERGRHPRFALGESSTPLANLALEEIAREYDLPWLAELAEYGRWRKSYPQLVCGLKRGFTSVRPAADRPFAPDPDPANELLVTASPADEVADTHWLRADFDHFLLEQAVTAGVPYFDRVELALSRPGAVPWRLSGVRQGGAVGIGARRPVAATRSAGRLGAG